jgi:hypothetical protein
MQNRQTDQIPATSAPRDRSTRSGSQPAWVGDFEIEETGDLERLYALAGIDPEHWRVCGVDVRLSYGRGLHAGIFAVEVERLREAGDWQGVSEQHDQRIPVTEFRLEPTAAHELLALFPDISLVAAQRHVVPRDGVELRVVESVLADHTTREVEPDPTWQPG